MTKPKCFHQSSTYLANADCDGARKVLTDFLLMIERYRAVDNPLFTLSTYHSDLMITHTRLSRIEDKLGNKKEAEYHLKMAHRACESSSFQNCSRTKLISISQFLEKKNPIACLADK